MHADCISEGVSPKARRNTPRAPLMSRSTRTPSEPWIQRRPPSLAIISPFQLQVLLVYADTFSLTGVNNAGCDAR